MPNYEKKSAYVERVDRLFSEYNRVLLVHCDNVGSAQMQHIRKALRGQAEMLMGKNTLIRKCMAIFLEKNEDHPVKNLVPLIRGNIGLVFTNDDLGDIRDVIEANRVPAPAKAGAVAPSDVVVPAGPTGCDPGQTSFFQALSIGTKISKGQVEIVSNVHLIAAGSRVNPGQAALLQKLGIRPFTYGLVMKTVYDHGNIFAARVLDLSEDDLAHQFLLGMRRIASVSMQTGLPTTASVPHSLVNAAKKLTAICTDDNVDYSFHFADDFLAYLADPSAFASAAGPAVGGGGGAAAQEEEEEEEEVADGAVGGLFGDDDEDDY